MRDVASPISVRFVLANNMPNSITRITADTADYLSRWGIKTRVYFPVIDWLDYKLFEISRRRGIMKMKWVARLILEFCWNMLTRSRWCGFRQHKIDPRVRGIRYFLLPAPANDEDDEITIVHHPYLIPRLMYQLRGLDAKLVSIIHNNYEREMQTPREGVPWKTHCVALEQRLAIPRIADSEAARAAAEQLGISSECVIAPGINLREFHPGSRRDQHESITISLYCSLNPQKGQRFGLDAIRELRSMELPADVRLCSIGHVLPGSEGLFDHNYGYQDSDAYLRALQESDIFIYPSLYDGFPAPPLQAMACDTAVVSTGVEGVREYGVDGENCLIVTPGDAEALRAQIVRLIHDEDLRRQLKEHGRRTAQNYSVERSTQLLLAFLDMLRRKERKGCKEMRAMVSA